MPAQPQTDEFEQYARPPVSAGADEFDQYERKTAAPTGVSATVDGPKNFAQRNPHLMDQVHEVEDMVKGTAKNLYQVSVPGIASSFFKEKFPSVASHLPGMMTENAAPLEKLPGKIATTLPLMAIGDEVPPEAKLESGIARPTPKPVAPESSMGSRAIEVGKRRVGNLPGVKAYKDADYILRGPKETPAAPSPTVAKPAPVPETNGVRWGTGGDSTIEQRGKIIPPEPPELSTESRTLPGMHSPEVIRPPQVAKPSAEPIPPRSGLQLKGEVADTSPKKVGQLLNEGTGGSRGIQPPEPGKPIYNRSGIPEGHTAEDSSWIASSKYNPATKEFEITTKEGGHYVRAEVTPEQAQKFSDAKSKGQAWQELKNNSTPSAKVVNGKRVSRIPTGKRTFTPDDEPPEAPEPKARIPGPNENMSNLGRQSLEMLKKRRGMNQ